MDSEKSLFQCCFWRENSVLQLFQCECLKWEISWKITELQITRQPLYVPLSLSLVFSQYMFLEIEKSSVEYCTVLLELNPNIYFIKYLSDSLIWIVIIIITAKLGE